MSAKFKGLPFEFRLPFEGIFYSIDGSDGHALFNLSKEYESFLVASIKTERNILELIPKSNEMFFESQSKSILRYEAKLSKIREAKQITTNYLHRNNHAIPGSKEDIQGKEMFKLYLANIKRKIAEEYQKPKKKKKVVKHKQKTLDQHELVRKMFHKYTNNMRFSVKRSLVKIANAVDLSPSYIKDIVYKNL